MRLFYDRGPRPRQLAACPHVRGQATYADPTPGQPTLAPSARRQQRPTCGRAASRRSSAR